MRFWKYHGLGNDFVLVENFDGSVPKDPEYVRAVCHRRFGIGADGILYLENSAKADFTMRVMNSDGSEAEMCGNGIRCLAKHVYDFGHKKEDELTIETGRHHEHKAGHVENGKAVAATVEMGAPRLECQDIPVKAEGRFIDRPISGRDGAARNRGIHGQPPSDDIRQAVSSGPGGRAPGAGRSRPSALPSSDQRRIR